MQSRRHFLKSNMALLGSTLLMPFNAKSNPLLTSSKWYLPEESELHKRTWMSFIASYDIWEEWQVRAVQRDLATIAKTIAKYEPVSMLVRKQDYKIALQLLGGLRNHNYPIELIEFNMNDLWMRDTGPTFVINEQGQQLAINFNFNGWGEKQDYLYDAEVADFVAKTAGVKTIHSNLILEGGCFEVDGQGTAIMTKSCILNDNRNPNKAIEEVETELKGLLGLDKIIWLEGIKGKDITDVHTDFYARFAKPGVVVVSRDTDQSSYDYKITRHNIEILKSSTDAKGNPFEIIIVDTPWDINTQFGINDFAAGYIGYYVCNDAVIMQKFGDRSTDHAAKQKIAKVFPNHQIEQIAIDGIASGGGSIHCTTQQQPKV